MSLDWYARLLIRLSKFKLAKECFIKAYEMSLKVNGSLHDQTAVLLNDIGTVCSLMKNYDEALEYLDKAITVAKETNNPDLPAFYINKGTVQLERKLLEEAQEFCHKGGLLAKIANDPATVEEAESCLNQIKQLKES